MISQFIPSVWPTLIPILIVVGLPLVGLFYRLYSRCSWASNRSQTDVAADNELDRKLQLALLSILSTIALFLLFNFLSWRYTEFTTPFATDLRSAAARQASQTEIIGTFGEPNDRGRSNSDNQTLEYSAIIKYSSWRWGVGIVWVEIDSDGNAIDTSTAD